jgi:hypothetical protein
MVTLILLLDVLELEIKVGVVAKLARHSQFLLNSPELVVVSTVVEQFYDGSMGRKYLSVCICAS